MIKGVTRPNEVAHLGLSNRLMARVGALLKKKLAATLAVLEAATPGSPLEAFFLRAELLQEAAALTSEKANALAKLAGVDAPLAVGDGDDAMRVLCLADELETDDAWAEESALPPQPLSARGSSVPARIETKSANDPGNDGGVYGEDHLARTRLKWMTSSDAGERIEALRVLVLSPLTNSEKAEVILHGLSDADESVRAEAASHLPGLGVPAEVASALVDLNRGDLARRIAAADKLDKISAHDANELAEGAAIVCAMSALKSDADRPLKIRLLQLLANRAATAGRNASRLSEVLRVVLALISTAFKLGPSSREKEELIGVSHRLVKELGRTHPESLRAILKAERERAPDAAVEAFTLVALFDLIPPGDADEDALFAWSAAYLARDIEEGRGSRAIGALMSRRGGAALAKLCAVFSIATAGAQKHLLILLDEMCRKPEAQPAEFARASAVILSAMESGSKALRMAAMECRLVFDARVPAESRRMLAESFLDSTGDFTFPFDIEKAESAVQRMGAPAVAPLISRLGKDRAPNERTRAARLLGELALVAKPELGAPPSLAAPGTPASSRPVSNSDVSPAAGRPEASGPSAAKDGGAPSEPSGFQFLQSALTDALRRLEAASLEADFPDRGEVFCALGKVISSPAAGIEANAVVTRTLLDAAKGPDAKLAPRALEGATYLASSRRAAPELIAETVALLKSALNTPEPEQIERTSKNSTGDTVFEIQGGERYAIDLPIVLKGFERVALAPNCAPPMTREIGALLLARWKEVCAGERVWGPANVYTLLEALRGIALAEKCGTELRLEIVKGLFARLTQTPAMQALVDILAADDTRPSAGLALGVGFAILGRRDAEGRFSDVDRADILPALARLAARKILIAPPSETERTPAAFRRLVVTELIKGAKDNVPAAGRALETLCESDALPKDLRAEAERRVKPRTEILRR